MLKMDLLHSFLILWFTGFVSLSQICSDRISSYRCNFLQKHGVCYSNKRKAAHYCARTCGLCGEQCYKSKYGCCRDGLTSAKGPNYWGCDEYCSDLSSPYFCRAIARVGFCKSPTYGNNCKFTCKLCRTCRDTNFYACETIAKSGQCEIDLPVTYNHCRKTCHVCGKKDPCFEFKCPDKYKCRVDGHGKPFCACRGHCRTEDHFTGTVCGRDGKEYKNLCKLKHSNCHLPEPVEVKTYGPCTKETTGGQSAFPNCVSSKYGCCIDGISFAQGPKFKGCPTTKCEDKLNHVCRRFTPDCPNPSNKNFMRMLCPETCFYCVSDKNLPR